MLGGDVMFATSTPLTIAIPALIASSVRQIPFVFEVRDMWPDVPIALGALRHPILQTFARQLELLTYRRAAHVVALAPGMREDIVAKGIPAGKVSVIPNGCDIHAFGGAAEGRSPRNDFEWLGTRKLVLCAGTIGRVHGVDYMVHLARIVGRIDPEVRFVAIGGGAEWERIRSLAASEGVLDRNFFIFRPVGQRVLAGWLHAADLSLALIGGPRIVWKDAVQNKFFDALAAGKPIASNFDGWQSQVAQEADVGITLDRDDIERSASQVLAVLADDAWRSGVPERARRLAEGAFSRDRHALELEAIFARVVNRVAPVAKSG
jgi:glycosyltransferase involved in cell wall biosynthesis